MRRCETCRYWESSHDRPWGDCRVIERAIIRPEADRVFLTEGALQIRTRWDYRCELHRAKGSA